MENDGLIGFTFDDHSGVRYSKDTGKIFGINLTYDAYNNFDDDVGDIKLGFPEGFRTPKMKPEMTRPIPSEPTIAETCFVEKWPLARACEIAGEVNVEDEDDGLVTCTFKDHSIVEFRKDFKNIFCVYFSYDTGVDGNLNIPNV